MMCRHSAECGVMWVCPGVDEVISAINKHKMSLSISGEIRIKKSFNVDIKQFKNSLQNMQICSSCE